MTKLVISIDVEEDGLFNGRYPRTPSGVANVGQLGRLDFIWDKYGIPLTLLPTYPVASDNACCAALRHLAEEGHAEIGAHLHPWCTPPFSDNIGPEPVRTDALPAELLQRKMQTLCDLIREKFGGAARSFRAGRFDLGRQLRDILPAFGIVADSSVVPLRRVSDGPADHFDASQDPFWQPAAGPGSPAVLEVPLTIVPLWPAAARIGGRIALKLPHPLQDIMFSTIRYLDTTGIHPAWFPLSSMKLAASIHRRRGGKVLNMFLHSSDLCPGASPAAPDEKSVQRLVNKIDLFLAWLAERSPVHGVTLSDPCLAPGSIGTGGPA